MKKELNIAAILKEKAVGTKLWSPLYGDVFLNRLADNDGIRVLCKGLDGSLGTDEKSFWKNGKYTLGGEVCLFPSKQMRDWSKFTWKKGDVLRFSDILVIFEKWSKDDYTEFKAAYEFNCHCNSFGKGNDYYTAEFCKASDDEAKEFIKNVEEHYGGKLNLSTLEIQKQPEFKTMDWCLIQVDRGDVWHLAQYASKYEDRYYFVGGMNVLITKEIIILPYNDQTAHLLGTTDEWKGGEG